MIEGMSADENAFEQARFALPAAAPRFVAAFGLTVALGLPALVACADGAEPNAAPKRPPSLVFILVDDLGWADIGCNGSSFYETPHVDALAAAGMRLTNAYAACPVCSPTRASILTGKYPARLKLTNFLVGLREKPGSPVLTAPYKHHLDLEEVTLAEALRSAGYTSAHVGKWHLGPKPYYPEKQGFAVNVAGTEAGMPRSYYFPAWQANVPLDGTKKDYLTDRLTDEALTFIEDNRARPFFLYLAFYAVHIPIQPRADLLAKYERKQPPGPQKNPHYAAMVDAVDQNVGHVLHKLGELGLEKDTVVFFFSDNGGLATPEGPHTPATTNAPLRAGKGYVYEGGIREPLVVRWPGSIPPGTVSDTPVTSVDFYPTILHMAGVDPARDQVLDGVDLVPLLTGTPGAADALASRPLFWHYPHFSNQGGAPGGAVREGRYKLIEHYEDGRLELFDLVDDVGESRNLAQEKPELTQRLHEKLVAWRASVDATMPLPNPKYHAPTK